MYTWLLLVQFLGYPLGCEIINYGILELNPFMKKNPIPPRPKGVGAKR